MNAQQKAPLMNYEQYWGTRKCVIMELAGPASYQTGGQTINASDIGWGGFDTVISPGMSYSGTYRAKVVFQPASNAPSGQEPGGYASVKIIWVVDSTGNQAGAIDLSGEILNIMLIGS